MCFSTGKPHPLASEQKLEISVAGAAAHNLSDTEVIGDYILYWVGTPTPIPSGTYEDSLCSIYLVAWKEGWVSEVRPPYTLDPTSISAQSKKSFFIFPLASHLPPAHIRLGLISTIRGDYPTDSAA
jgi:hypothetical protein